MAPKIPEEIKDYIDTKLQDYTMVLDKHIVECIQGAIANSINKAVDDKLKSFHNEFSNYVKSDEKWKQSVNEVVEFFNNLTWSKKFFMGVLAFIGAIFGVGIAIKTLFFK